MRERAAGGVAGLLRGRLPELDLEGVPDPRPDSRCPVAARVSRVRRLRNPLAPRWARVSWHG